MKKIKNNKAVIIRDISWLAFNERVLQEASDNRNHPYDRLRFLGIFSNNQDEFFRVRVAALSRMTTLGKKANMHLEDNPEKILEQIQSITLRQQRIFARTYATILKELAGRNIFIKNEKQLTVAQQEYVKTYFNEKVRTRIAPLMFESIPQTPPLKDKSIYLACVLGSSTNTMMRRYTLIEIPTENISRFSIIPSTKEGHINIILLEDIIRANMHSIFAPFGFDTYQGNIVKVTRDAELDFDNDEHTNVIVELEKGLKNRKKGRTTRLVYDRQIDIGLFEYLITRLGLTTKDNLVSGGRIHNFKDFMDFPASVFNDLKKRNKPFVHPNLLQPCRIMDIIETKDVMLNFPYHSFDSVIDLVREAAIDPNVQSIKITCYRLAKDSKVINALVNAVRNGKQVSVILELRARFDEEANLKWKKKLEEEGVKVFIGIPDMKVHAKLCLITKKTFNKIKHYGFVSTGNINESTAKLYGDHCLLTTNKKILNDVARIFRLLESPKPQNKLSILDMCKTLPVSPKNMRGYFINEIDKEIKIAKSGKKAEIIIKLNSLVDKIFVEKLYEAAEAGVEVNLIIRGICCVVTHQKKFKIPIFALSIVDELLEHARIFVFHNNGDPTVYISSADWMVRNLDHRIEAACPIYDPAIKKELIDILRIQLKENVKGRVLDNNQTNNYILAEENETVVRSQVETFNYLLEKVK